jgi:hypothetical protein
MTKLVSLCLGLALLALQFGCGGGANTNNANGGLNTNGPNPANPNQVNPNNPNTPANVNGPPGGPITQENGKPGRPPLNANANTISPAPTQEGGLSMATMDFHGALLRGNKDQLTALMADDYKGTMLDGSVQNKAQALAALKQSDQMYSATVQPPQVKGNAATMSGTLTLMSGDPANSKPGEVLKFTDTWQKHGDKWLITSTKITK